MVMVQNLCSAFVQIIVKLDTLPPFLYYEYFKYLNA